MIAPTVLAVLTWALVAAGVRRDRPHLVLLGWAVLPGLAAAGWSLILTPVYQERYFTWCVPALAMLVGAGLDRLAHRSVPHRMPRCVAVVAVAALAATPIAAAQRHTDAKYGQDYRTLAARVASVPRAGTGLIYASPGSRAASVVYPGSFHGLTDLSAAAGPVETGTFWGADRPTDVAIADIRRRHLTHVLFLYEWMQPLDARPELRRLRAAGCRLDWTLPVRRTNAAWFTCG